MTCGGVKYSSDNNSNNSANISENDATSCGTHYFSYNGKCVRKPVKIPQNAYPTSSSAVGWKCSNGFESKGNKCYRKIPYNASPYGNSWKCNSGYYETLLKGHYDICEKLPNYAIAVPNGIGYLCISGYKKSVSGCVLSIPANAYASGYGWKCNPGYERKGDYCVKELTIPPNAYASGSGWECNPGFEKEGNSCREIVDETIYPASSGTGFATTKDGHIITNYHVIDGCSEVALLKNGKSYLTTVITQDPNNDLAILQSNFMPTKVYPLSSEVYLSDDIFAAGFPFGTKLRSSITINKGIISALKGLKDDISQFQIDAIINPGNSGGPIVDRRGNAVGIAVSTLNKQRATEDFNLSASPEGFNFAVNSMMAIGLFRSQGIELPSQNNNELSVKDRNDLFNQGTFFLSCGMTIAQYEKMIQTDKVMYKRDVFFRDFEGN